MHLDPAIEQPRSRTWLLLYAGSISTNYLIMTICILNVH